MALEFCCLFSHNIKISSFNTWSYYSSNLSQSLFRINMEELQENIQQARDFALKNNYDSSLVVITFLKCLSISWPIFSIWNHTNTCYQMFNIHGVVRVTWKREQQETTKIKRHLLSRSDNSYSTLSPWLRNCCIWSKSSMASQGTRVCIIN